MKNFFAVFSNRALLCALGAWILAQGIKFCAGLIRQHRIDFSLLTRAGGMPSSHSATVCALATAVGLQSGFDSVSFAITVILALVVMYDACGVRRAAGEQAKILNRMIRDLEEGKTVNYNVRLKEFLGHTKVEVLAGALLGILLSTLVCALACYTAL